MSEVIYDHPAGDLEPPFTATLLQGNSTPVAGLGAALRVELVMTDLRTGREVLRRDATIADPTGAVISLVWLIGDPAQTPGLYLVKARIHWSGDRPQTIPSRDADKFLLRVH